MSDVDITPGRLLPEPQEQRTLDYGLYAVQFDRLCELLPVYQDNVRSLIELIPTFDLPPDAKICDLGAGTGNYICALFNQLPHARFTHVDVDPVMNSVAHKKYAEHGIENVEIVEEYIQQAHFADASFDLVVCVNALNTAPPQLPVLGQIRRWIKPGGWLYLIDFGRKQKVLDWGWYILTNTIRAHGVGRYIKALYENREAIRQNRRAAKDQNNGLMWTHSPEEFRQLVETAGFQIERSSVCYRGYCDLVVARP